MPPKGRTTYRLQRRERNAALPSTQEPRFAPREERVTGHPSPTPSGRRRGRCATLVRWLPPVLAVLLVLCLFLGLIRDDFIESVTPPEDRRDLLPSDGGLCDPKGCPPFSKSPVVSTTTTLDPIALASKIRQVQSVTSYRPRVVRDIPAEFVPAYTVALDNFIRTQCDIVRKAIMTKWLPQARRDVDGVFRLHMGFVGESHARVMRRDVIEDIQVCLPGKIHEDAVHCEVPYAWLCRATVFEPELTGLEDPPIQPGTQLVLSIHQLPFAKNLVQTLANAYLPLFQNASEEKRHGDYAALFQPSISLNLKPTVRATEAADVGRPRPGTWLSPSLSLRAPDILYLNTGSWDIVHAEPVWSDYEVYSHDVYMRPDFGAYLPTLVERLVTSLRANYSLPMQALLRVLADAWEEDRFKSGDIHPETQAFMPPRKVVLSTPPAVNCSGWYHLPRSAEYTWFDYRRYLRGFARCAAIVYPLETAARGVFSELALAVARERAATLQARALFDFPRLPQEVLLSWTEKENVCLRSDSIHLDYHVPYCRNYITRYFYSNV